jgi:hypothetical protein
MSRHLPRHELERLSKLCGMFGSDHAGERAAAAAKADQLVRKLGLTWNDVLISTPRALAAPPASSAQKLAFVRQHLRALNSWEIKFINDVAHYRRLTPGQLTIVDQLIAKIERRSRP